MYEHFSLCEQCFLDFKIETCIFFYLNKRYSKESFIERKPYEFISTNTIREEQHFCN